MRQTANRDGAGADTDEPSFRHSSECQDLEALIDDHLLDADKAAATAGWYPSRRGVSPRGAGPKTTRTTSAA
jgi:hypothetical protein